MARRASFVDDLRKAEVPFVLVDAGSFSHKNKRNLAETKATWTEMARLGYDAVTFGFQELNQWDELDSLRSNVDLPLVCTNLEQSVDGQWVPLGEPYRIVERNGIRVGVMSVVNDIVISNTVRRRNENKVRILDPHETTRLVSRKLRDQCEVVVLLAYLDPGTMMEYADSMEDVDVVVGGHMPITDLGPAQMDSAILNRAGTRGRAISSTRLIISPDDEICEFGGKNITLTVDMPEDPVIAQAALQAQASSKEAKDRKRNARKAAAADEGQLPIPDRLYKPDRAEKK